MRATDRYTAIERELRLRGRVQVVSLAKKLAVSVISIRRDLNVLEDRGIARRVHGGAVFSGEPAPPEGPMTNAAAVRSRKDRGILGIVVPDSAYYYAAVIAGAEEAAKNSGYRLVLAVSGYSGDEERRQITRLVGIGALGIVIAPSVHDVVEPATYEALAELRVPVVLMERKADRARFDVVYSEHASGVVNVMQYLSGLGHRGVLLVTAEHSATTPALVSGFMRAVKQCEPERCEVVLIPPAPANSTQQRSSLAKALERANEIGATALIVHTDELAMLLTQLALGTGVQVPEEVSIVAYDDEIAALAEPPLDAVSPPKLEVGRRAVRLCVERLESDSSPNTPQHIGLLPTLVIRNSSAPPMSSGPASG